MSGLGREERIVNEESSAVFVADLVDQDGNPVGANELDTLTQTQYDIATGTIINSRNNTDVLNNGMGVTLDAAGQLIWRMDPVDTIIINSNRPAGELEHHMCLFTYSWQALSGVTLTGRQEIPIDVRQLDKVPPA